MIVVIGPAAEPGVVVTDSDNLTRLHVEATDIAHVDAALKTSGLGYLEGEHAWLSVAGLRDNGAGQAPDWTEQYTAMIDYAVGKGWCTTDHTYVRAHVEQTQRKADA